VSKVRGALKPTAGDLILGLRRRLVEVDAWQDGSVKAVAQDAVRAEITRLGQELTELEWRWA